MSLKNQIIEIDINKISTNPDNPRFIKDAKFEKLKKSIKDFPEMLKLRPIVVNKEMVVLGGNMRLAACRAVGLKKIYIIKAENLTAEQQNEFIIKDNVGFGEWDWSVLANEWNSSELNDWGLDVWQNDDDVDYSVLDDDDVDDVLKDLQDGVKRAIQIEFNPEDYDEAYELVKYFRDNTGDVGKVVLELLKTEKSKS